MPNSKQRGETEGKATVLLRSPDGGLYAIPNDTLETFRMSDEQRSELKARLPDEQRAALEAVPTGDDDVQGYSQYIGQFRMTQPWFFFGVLVSGADETWQPNYSYYPPLH